jgi:type II secretory pathway pseudopilin PulG
MVNKKGFTLIEAVISIGVMSILIPVIFGLFFTTLRSELRVRVLKSIKSNGDSTLTYISNIIRESAFKSLNCPVAGDTTVSEMTTTPSGSQSSVCFKTKDDKCFKIFVDDNNGRKAIKVDNLPDEIANCNDFLTSTIVLTNTDDVTINTSNPFTVDVPTSVFRTGSVTTSFVVTSTKDPETSLNYYSKAKVRNY